MMEKNGGVKPDWIVGRVFAEWCGHCQNMKEDWKSLKEVIEKEKGGKIKFIDIEDIHMDKLKEMNDNYFDKKQVVQSSGFPTIFVFHVNKPNNTLDYYKGERNLGSMKDWIETHMKSSHNKSMGGSRKRKENKKAKRGSRKNIKTGEKTRRRKY